MNIDGSDAYRDARIGKTANLAKMVWFWLTTFAFAWICWNSPIEAVVIETGIGWVKLFAGVMTVLYGLVSIVQTQIWWWDDMDGLLRPEDRWRF